MWWLKLPGLPADVGCAVYAAELSLGPPLSCELNRWMHCKTAVCRASMSNLGLLVPSVCMRQSAGCWQVSHLRGVDLCVHCPGHRAHPRRECCQVQQQAAQNHAHVAAGAANTVGLQRWVSGWAGVCGQHAHAHPQLVCDWPTEGAPLHAGTRHSVHVPPEHGPQAGSRSACRRALLNALRWAHSRQRPAGSHQAASKACCCLVCDWHVEGVVERQAPSGPSDDAADLCTAMHACEKRYV